MKIKALTLANFSVFKHAQIEFCPGINVFIGANATGKTHAMKLLYSVLRALDHPGNGANGRDKLAQRLEQKLAAVFKPEHDQLGRLVRNIPPLLDARIKTELSPRGMVAFSLGRSGELRVKETPPGRDGRSIYISSRETLAMFEGFIPSYQERELSVEETFYDLCVALSAARLRHPDPGLAELVARLEEIMGGEIRLMGNRFYLYDRKHDKATEAHLMAEGMRKLGVLAQLLRNGGVRRDTILFWDEPEANLNPLITVVLAGALRRIAGAGAQVFIATHDFLLASELSLAVEYKLKPMASMRFFGLNKEDEQPVTIECGSELSDLQHVAMINAYSEHHDRKGELFFEAPKKGGRNG